MSSIRQREPEMVTDHVGYVEEIGWQDGPAFFPVIAGKCREIRDSAGRYQSTDYSADRGVYKTPEEALVAAVALWRGWDRSGLAVLLQIVNMRAAEAPAVVSGEVTL